MQLLIFSFGGFSCELRSLNLPRLIRSYFLLLFAQAILATFLLLRLPFPQLPPQCFSTRMFPFLPPTPLPTPSPNTSNSVYSKLQVAIHHVRDVWLSCVRLSLVFNLPNFFKLTTLLDLKIFILTRKPYLVTNPEKQYHLLQITQGCKIKAW